MTYENHDWWYSSPLWRKLLLLPFLIGYLILLGFVVMPALHVWEGLKKMYGWLL